jgi:radical SAM-linked protein
MAYIGHLDLVHVFERALRRASLPVSMDESQFHTRPRIRTALPLPLGATSNAEIMEIELTRVMDLDEFKTKFAAELPPELPILTIQTAPVLRVNGRIAESATSLLDRVGWSLAFEMLPVETSGAADVTTGANQEALEVRPPPESLLNPF